jgi:hypothetical protein
MVRELPDVFPHELPGMPPKRAIELSSCSSVRLL